MAFAQGNCIRHLLSGGYFIPAHLLSTPLDKTSELPCSEMLIPSNWHTVGPGPLHLIDTDQTVQSYLGLSDGGERMLLLGIILQSVALSQSDELSGKCKTNKQQDPCPFNQTLTGTKLPGIVGASADQRYVTEMEICLLNGDKCMVGQHVIVWPPYPNMPTFIACLREIIQQVGSQNHDNSKPDGLLLETIDLSSISTRFQMPHLQYRNEWSFILISVSFTPILSSD